MYIAGLGVVLTLYVVLVSLAMTAWVKLARGFDPDDTTRIACEVRMFVRRNAYYGQLKLITLLKVLTTQLKSLSVFVSNYIAGDG